jgi:histidine triad (HIT) family protein
MEDVCIFCKIIRKEIDSNIIFEDDKFIVFSDISPVAEIHKLIVPKKHINNLTDFKDNSLIIYWEDVIKVINKLVDILEVSNFKIVINNGDKLQLVKHLHLHFLSGEKVNDKVN